MDPYATHQYILVKALLGTANERPGMPILECGCGDYSSPLIHALRDGREYDIWSADPDWSDRFRGIADSVTTVALNGPKEWSMPGFDRDYGLCLMDSEESVVNRASRIPELLNHCSVVVMHDAREDVIPEAKYRAVFTLYRPWTWIGSNEVDITQWI